MPDWTAPSVVVFRLQRTHVTQHIYVAIYTDTLQALQYTNDTIHASYEIINNQSEKNLNIIFN